jgi:maternal embryonic leucine zipper kinase
MKLNEEISLMYRKNFRTMKCLNHPNILKYRSLYLDKTSQTSYLVMEYLPYPTLKGLKLSHEN